MNRPPSRLRAVLGALLFLLTAFCLLTLSGCTTARIELLDRDGRVVMRGHLTRALSAAKDQEISLKPDGTLAYSVGESDGAAMAGQLVEAAVEGALRGAAGGK